MIGLLVFGLIEAGVFAVTWLGLCWAGHPEPEEPPDRRRAHFGLAA